MKRAIVIVCDSLGVGELPDAADFGDEGSNTLGHILQAHHPSLPTLARLGLLHTLPQPAAHDAPSSAYGRMTEVSSGKDTITGHWEMMGLVVADPFRTYPNGFPPEVIAEYERRLGRKTLGNTPASGGCDPCDVSTDHTREDVPMLIAGPSIVAQRPLGTRSTFADLGATVADYLDLPRNGLPGTSALPEVRKGTQPSS